MAVFARQAAVSAGAKDSAGHRHRRDLDGLRGLAIIGVLGFHAHQLDGGDTGVVLFFVLSGYLITNLLLREHATTGRMDARQFYTRRAARLFPALVLALAGYAILSSTIGDNARAATENILSALLYIRDILGAYVTHHNGSLGWSWSLAIEEQFYLVWPVVLAIALRRRRPGIAMLLAAAGILSATIERFVMAPSTHLFIAAPHYGAIWLIRSYDGIDTRMDAILLGCLLALALNRWPHALRRVEALPFGVAGLATLGIAFRYPNILAVSSYTTWLTVSAVASTVLLYSLVVSPPGPLSAVLGVRPLAYIGQISYGLYVWNSTMQLYVSRRWPRYSADHQELLWIGASLVLASASYYLVERPILRRVGARRDRSSSPVAAPVPDLGVPAATPAALPSTLAAG